MLFFRATGATDTTGATKEAVSYARARTRKGFQVLAPTCTCRVQAQAPVVLGASTWNVRCKHLKSSDEFCNYLQISAGASRCKHLMAFRLCVRARAREKSDLFSPGIELRQPGIELRQPGIESRQPDIELRQPGIEIIS